MNDFTAERFERNRKRPFTPGSKRCPAQLPRPPATLAFKPEPMKDQPLVKSSAPFVTSLCLSFLLSAGSLFAQTAPKPTAP